MEAQQLLGQKVISFFELLFLKIKINILFDKYEKVDVVLPNGLAIQTVGNNHQILFF